MNFLDQGFRMLEHYYRQTRTRTDSTENIIRPHSRVVKWLQNNTTL